VLHHLSKALEVSGVLGGEYVCAAIAPEQATRFRDGDVSIRIDGQERRYAIKMELHIVRRLDLERFIAQVDNLDHCLRHCHVIGRGPGKGHFTACFQNADGFWLPSVNCCHDARCAVI